MTRTLLAAAAVLALAPAARAGHSRHSYFDGGQSPDGRFTVRVHREDLPPTPKKAAANYRWHFTWTDTRTGEKHTGPLAGYRKGEHIAEQLHAHVFVPPGGETFAVWNPQALAFIEDRNRKAPPDLTAPESRDFPGFAARLVVYKRTGEVIKELAVKDFLKDDDWQWLFCYGCQVFWQAEYPGLATRSTPRPAYALYRISPDHTVLETLVGATAEAAYKGKARGVTPPAPRVVRVDLGTGAFLPPDAKLPPERIPGKPFKGPDAVRDQPKFVPSADPVRVEGTFVPDAKD